MTGKPTSEELKVHAQTLQALEAHPPTALVDIPVRYSYVGLVPSDASKKPARELSARQLADRLRRKRTGEIISPADEEASEPFLTPAQRAMLATIETLDSMISAPACPQRTDHIAREVFEFSHLSNVSRQVGSLASKVLAWAPEGVKNDARTLVFNHADFILEHSRDEQNARELRWYVSKNLALAFDVVSFAQLSQDWSSLEERPRVERLLRCFRVNRKTMIVPQILNGAAFWRRVRFVARDVDASTTFHCLWGLIDKMDKSREARSISSNESWGEFRDRLHDAQVARVYFPADE